MAGHFGIDDFRKKKKRGRRGRRGEGSKEGGKVAQITANITQLGLRW